MTKKDWNKTFRQRMVTLINERRNVPCHDCAGSFPICVMEFDHRDGKSGSRRDTVSSMAHRCGEQKLIEEMNKCDVVCANCHKVRTYNRR